MKITKKKLKEISEEGISEEMIINCQGVSPVQLVKGEEPVEILKCKNGFWILIEGGFLKDEKNQYVIINEIDAKIGRARYCMNFKKQIEEEETEKAIQKEIKNLISKTKQKVEEYLPNIKFILQLADLVESDFSFVLRKRMLEEKGNLESSVIEAKDIASQEDYLYSYQQILKWYNEENWDSLYIYFFQEGLPEIASFDISNLEGLKKYFHRDKINETIESIQSNNHLYNVAKFKIATP